jgi:hypothetical protein
MFFNVGDIVASTKNPIPLYKVLSLTPEGRIKTVKALDYHAVYGGFENSPNLFVLYKKSKTKENNIDLVISKIKQMDAKRKEKGYAF